MAQHYFTAPPTGPFPCSGHVIEPRLLYNCHCHLASALRTWFMDKIRAVLRPLRDQAYLILSGSIKQSTTGLANCNMMNYEEIPMMIFIIFLLLDLAEKKLQKGIMFCRECKYCTCSTYLHQLQWIKNIKRSKFCLISSQFLSTYYIAKILFFMFSSLQCKRRFDGAVEKTTLSQADLEVGCISFSPHSASASLSGL